MSLFVSCGIEGEHRVDELFWPLFAARPRNCPLELKEGMQTSLVWTSRHAVSSIASSPEAMETLLRCQNSITFCAVGQSTAEELRRQILKPLHLENQEILLPQKGHGLENVLEALKSGHGNDFLMILTVTDGNASDVLKRSSWSTKPFAIRPVYELVPCGGPPPERVCTALQQNTVPKSQVHFRCRSGRVLREVLQFLQEHFGCPLARNLPDWIIFEVWGQSAKDVASKEGLGKVKELC